jgi:hypothetical protein
MTGRAWAVLAAAVVMISATGCKSHFERVPETGADDRAGVTKLQEITGDEPVPGTYAFPLTPKDEERVHTVRGWGIVKQGDWFYYLIEFGKELRWFHSSRLVGVRAAGSCLIDDVEKTVYEIQFRL